MHKCVLIIILIILFICLAYLILNAFNDSSVFKGGAAPLEIDNEIGTCEYLSLLNSIFNSPKLVKFIFEEFEEHDTLHTTENFNILTKESLQKVFNFWIKDPFKYIDPEPEAKMNNHKVIPVLIGRMLYFAYKYPHSTKEYESTGALYKDAEFSSLRLKNSDYRNMYSFILGRLSSVLLYTLVMIENKDDTYANLLENISKMPNADNIPRKNRLLIESLKTLKLVDTEYYDIISSSNPNEEFRKILRETVKYVNKDKYICIHSVNPVTAFTRLLNDKYYRYYVYLLRACVDLFVIHMEGDSYYITFCSDVELSAAPKHSTYYDIPNNLHADNGNRGYLPVEFLLTLKGDGYSSLRDIVSNRAAVSDYIWHKESNDVRYLVVNTIHLQTIKINIEELSLLPKKAIVILDSTSKRMLSTIKPLLPKNCAILDSVDTYLPEAAPDYPIGTYASYSNKFALLLLDKALSQAQEMINEVSLKLHRSPTSMNYVLSRDMKNRAQLYSAMSSPYNKFIRYDPDSRISTLEALDSRNLTTFAYESKHVSGKNCEYLANINPGYCSIAIKDEKQICNIELVPRYEIIKGIMANADTGMMNFYKFNLTDLVLAFNVEIPFALKDFAFKVRGFIREKTGAIVIQCTRIDDEGKKWLVIIDSYNHTYDGMYIYIHDAIRNGISIDAEITKYMKVNLKNDIIDNNPLLYIYKWNFENGLTIPIVKNAIKDMLNVISVYLKKRKYIFIVSRNKFDRSFVAINNIVIPVDTNWTICYTYNFLKETDELNLFNPSEILYSIEPNWHVMSNGRDAIDIKDGTKHSENAILPTEIITSFIIHEMNRSINFPFKMYKYFKLKGIKLIVCKPIVQYSDYLTILVTDKSEDEIMKLLRISKIEISDRLQDIELHKFMQIKLEEYLNPTEIQIIWMDVVSGKYAEGNHKLMKDVKIAFEKNKIKYLSIDACAQYFALTGYKDYIQANYQNISNVINTISDIQDFKIESEGTIKEYLNINYYFIRLI